MSMPDILLTHGYFLSQDPAEQRVMKPYAPLGILSLAAYLDRHGFHSQVFDSTFSSLEDFARSLETLRPPVVGISINMMTKFAAIRMMRLAKQAGARVIVGGPEPAYYAEDFLAQGADVVVRGEGEQTLAALLPRLLERTPQELSDIPGLVFRNASGRVWQTPARGHVDDIDALPVPDRSKIDLRKYLSTWRERHGYASLSMVTMRGCPFSCTWCSHAVYGESYRRRSPHLVVEELAQLRADYAPEAFWFADDVFTISHSWLSSFASELARRDLRIRYECITRADRMNDRVIDDLRRTGCTRVWIGSESGSQKILDAMNRKVLTGQIRDMVSRARNAGMEVGMFIMLGYEGESRSDIEQTVRHVQMAHPDIVLTTVAYPIKGTQFYQLVADRMRVPSLPFDAWNDRMIEISGRFSRRFYWFANRRVINEAAWKRLLHTRNRSWGRLLLTFVKAKIAQMGMACTA